MKSLLFLIVVLLPVQVFALTFDVIGPCSSKPVYKGVFKTDLEQSVGAITLEIFDFHQIPYVGSEEAINNILNAPTGFDAMEVISDTKMRAYGWCYSINGMIPDALPGKVRFTNQNDHISWFYAYSSYDRGNWTDYCVPSYKIKSPQICKN